MLNQTVRRAFRDIYNNLYLHLICVITISLSVFILSAFALFYMNATELLDAWKKGVRVIAYLAGDLSEERIEEVETRIESLQNVADVAFVSRERAFAALKADIGEQASLLEGLQHNPLPDAFEIRVAGSMASIDSVASLAASVKALEEVEDVDYARKWLSRFAGVYKLFRVTGLALVAMFFIATVFIVSNTLRLILYSRREEIEVMRIVGADERFIKSPFYLEAVFMALAGGFLGLFSLYLTYMATVPRFAPQSLFSFYEIRFLPAAAWLTIIFLSVVIGWAGCHFSIKRFLRT
jgi:cell division transport system permease protein